MLDFITIGGATRDIFFKVAEAKKKNGQNKLSESFLLLPYGEKLIAQDTYYTYGGGSANASICLSRLGAKVGAMCNIGAEGTGSLLVSTLKSEKINTDMVSRDPKHHTGLSIFLVGKDNDHTGILERGANDFLSFKERNLKRTRWIYLSSLTGDAVKMLPQLFDYAERNKIKIAFNPGSQQLKGDRKELNSYIARSEILILNIEEAVSLVIGKKKCKNIRELLRYISGLGAKITVITDGGAGSHVFYEGKVYSQEAASVKVVDTTGAGDSFGATFAYSISKGHDVRYSQKIASINSASVVSFMGAQEGLLTHRKIKESSWL